jgi:hypothetical protein
MSGQRQNLAPRLTNVHLAAYQAACTYAACGHEAYVRVACYLASCPVACEASCQVVYGASCHPQYEQYTSWVVHDICDHGM